jgi:hypothetical protein
MRAKTIGLVSVLILSITSQAALACDDGGLCGVTAQNAKDMIADPKCKNDPKCVDCVANAASSGQLSAYCGGYNDAKKGKGIEKATGILNLAAAGTCLASCVAGFIPGASAALDKACGYLGLGVMLGEVASTVASLAQGDQGLMGIVGLAGSVGTAKANWNLAKNGFTNNFKATKFIGKAKEGLANPACLNTVIFGLTAKSKLAQVASMNKSAANSCTMVNSLATSPMGIVNTCMKPVDPKSPDDVHLSGLFLPTKDTSYVRPTADDAEKVASTAGSDKYLRQMKSEIANAEKAGKIDMADLERQVDAGKNPSDILGAMGLPGEYLDELKKQEARIDKHESSPLLAAVIGGGYSAGGSSSVAADGGGAAFGEMGFGNQGATPSEGVTATLEIDRQPSEAKQALGAGDDVFHSAFGGTIFDIVSLRIKESKGTYAELDPEGRMNRVFNGYSDPTSRAPAAAGKPRSSNREAR